jgi:hypothetical protein
VVSRDSWEIYPVPLVYRWSGRPQCCPRTWKGTSHLHSSLATSSATQALTPLPRSSHVITSSQPRYDVLAARISNATTPHSTPVQPSPKSPPLKLIHTPHFLAHNADGQTWQGRSLVLAAGVRDQFPDLQGFAENWPANIYQCPSVTATSAAMARSASSATRPSIPCSPIRNARALSLPARRHSSRVHRFFQRNLLLQRPRPQPRPHRGEGSRDACRASHHSRTTS